MSRSGYTDDCDDMLAYGRWRGAVKSALNGASGQKLLHELLDALDAMPDKKLYSGSFATIDGEFCTLGVLGAQRGTKMDDLGDDDDGCDTQLVGQRFDIAPALAAEIMEMNDSYMVDEYKWVEMEFCGPPRFPRETHFRSVRVLNENHPQQRWQAMREWVHKAIIESSQEKKLS